MDRRQFFKEMHPIRPPEDNSGSIRIEALKRKDPRRVQADLTEKTEPLTRKEAAHLLRRIAINPSLKEIEYYTGKTPQEAIDELLGDGLDHLPENAGRLPNPEGMLAFIDKPIQNPNTTGTIILRNQLENQLRSRYNQLVDYLIDLMRTEDLTQGPAVEKPTLFLMSIWNMEFTYDTRGLIAPNLLWKNNLSLRKYRLGNYSDIAKVMTLDGAFLLYQSLQLSTKSAPNENFARELMELFTMGIGHYSEGDIQEASRILTGWRTAPFNNSPHPNGYFETWFSPNDHDVESKQVMGESFPARTFAYNNENKVRDEEVFKLVDVLFERRPTAIAEFIMRKFYKFYVYSNPGGTDDEFITLLSQRFVDNNFNLREAYRTLFTSQHFYDQHYIGSQIKMPVEFTVGLEKILNANYSDSQNSLRDLEQTIYDPPNVSGWKTYRSWISTVTYPSRVNHGLAIVQSKTGDEIINICKQVPAFDDPTQFLDNLTDYLFPVTVSNDRKSRYFGILYQRGVNASNFGSKINSNDSGLADNLKELFEAFIKSPDIQLA